MRNIKNFLLLPLLALLILLIVVGTQLYRDREAALEYSVALLTDYRLSINGPFRFRLAGNVARIELSDSTLLSGIDDAVLLTAGRLVLEAEFNGLSLASIKVRELLLRDAKASLIRDQNGGINWPLSSNGSPSENIDWNKMLGKLSVKNSQLAISGFSAQDLQLELTQLELSDTRAQRQLLVEGQLNQHPLQFSARLEDLSGFLLEQKTIKLSASGRIHTLNIKADGVLGISSNQTRLQLAVDAEDLAELSNIVSEELPQLDHLSATAILQEQDGNYQFRDIDLSLGGPAITLNASGVAGQRGDALIVAIKLAAKLADIGKLSPRQELVPWRGWTAGFETDLAYKAGRGQLINTRFNASDSKQGIHLKANTIQLLHHGQTITDLQINNADLAYQFTDPLLGEKPWHYQYLADSVIAKLQPNHDVQIKTQGQYKTLPVFADGLWQADGDYRFDVSLDQAKASIEGYLRESIFNINGKLTTPSLKPLAILVNEDEVPIDRSELDIGILVQGNIIELSHLKLLLINGDSQIKVDGNIDNLSDLNAFEFEVQLAATQLAELNQWLSSSATPVDRTLAALGKPVSFASEGDVAYRKSLPIQSPWMNTIIQQLSLSTRIADYPMLNGNTQVDLTVTGANNATLAEVSRFDINSALANIQWAGHLQNSDDEFSLIGQLHANLKKSALEQLTTASVIDTSTAIKGDGPLQLRQLHFVADQTELHGNLDLNIEDTLQAVTGNLDFKQLDIIPYFPEPRTDDASKQAEDNKDSNPHLFSSEAFPLQWLPSFAINLNIKASKFTTPWLEASAVNIHISHKDNVFKLDPVTGAIGDGVLSGHFHLDNSGKSPAASLSIHSDKFDPDEISLMRDYDLLRKGHMSVAIELEGQGANEQELAATVNGKITAVTRDTLLNGSDLDDLAPAVFKEINRKVNPFYDKDRARDTELECGIIHFDIHDGLMEADKSIILVTPEIVFGAHGVIDLKNDQLRMQIIPRTRKGLGLSLSGTFAEMAVIDGSISNPGVSFDARSAAVTGTRDVTGTVLLGPLYWIYLGQAQKFLASRNACEKVIATVAPEFSTQPK